MHKHVALIIVLFSCGPAKADFLYVANQGGDDILRVDTSTGAQTVVSSGGYLTLPSGIAIASDGSLLVANRYSADIIRINPTTGAQSIVSSGGLLADPYNLVIDKDGSIFVADTDAFATASGKSGIIKINPTTGA